MIQADAGDVRGQLQTTPISELQNTARRSLAAGAGLALRVSQVQHLKRSKARLQHHTLSPCSEQVTCFASAGGRRQVSVSFPLFALLF